MGGQEEQREVLVCAAGKDGRVVLLDPAEYTSEIHKAIDDEALHDRPPPELIERLVQALASDPAKVFDRMKWVDPLPQRNRKEKRRAAAVGRKKHGR